MSSSISSSDAFSGRPGDWRRFVRVALATLAGLTLTIFAAAILLDPYDTGRFGVWDTTGVRQQGPRTANASRGRDPQFESAIIGNSHVQLISPARMTEATGQRFVSLMVPGTLPRETVAVLDWFVSRPRPKLTSVIIGIDANWCTGDPALPQMHPFPFWLYSLSNREYLAGLLRLTTLEEFGRRIEYLAGRRNKRAASDGYWDYEPNYLALGYGVNPAFIERLQKREPVMPANPGMAFPALELLRGSFARLPAGLRVVIFHNPTYLTGMSAPDPHLMAVEAACKAEVGALAASRPNTIIVDWMTDRPETRDASLWFDKTHFRRPVVDSIEKDLAAALR